MSQRKRAVRFTNQVDLPLTTVHEVPADGRGLGTGYRARLDRLDALRRVQGLRVRSRTMDDIFGSGDEMEPEGLLSKYTDSMARRDLWHAKRYGYRWYKHRPDGLRPGRLLFVSRYDHLGDLKMHGQMSRDYTEGLTRHQPATKNLFGTVR